VDFLGLLDANPVLDPLTGLPIAQTPFLGLLDTVLARLDDPAVTGDELAELTADDTWVQLMGAPIIAGASGSYLRTALSTARACMRAAMDYQPRPYPGPVHLFQAAGAGADRQAPLEAAIRGLCTGPCTVVPLAGDHWEFIRNDNATATAAELDDALERAGTTGSVSHGS
jgi:thioesterase domain-containing protein